MDSLDRDAVIAQAMRKKFGKLLDWEPPKLNHTFGQNDVAEGVEFETKLNEVKTEVLDHFAAMPDNEIGELSSYLIDPNRIDNPKWLALSAQLINQLRKHIPPPIAYGFGHPKFAVNFKHWGRMPKLSLHEVTLLSVGANPKSVDSTTITKLQESQKNGKPLWGAHEFLLEQHEVFRRHFYHTGFGYLAEPTVKIKGWIDKIELPVHPEFYAELEKRHSRQATPAGLPKANETLASKTLAPQERDTLLKLVAAMAVRGYAFDPAKSRNSATSDIKTDLELLGLPLDEKTILKWLRMATGLIKKDNS